MTPTASAARRYSRATLSMFAIGVAATAHICTAYSYAPPGKKSWLGIVAVGLPNLLFVAALLLLALRVKVGRSILAALGLVSAYGLLSIVVVASLLLSGKYKAHATVTGLQIVLLTTILYALFALWRASHAQGHG